MRWEYLVVNFGNLGLGALKEKLDEHGREGWELAAIAEDGLGRTGIFKRSVSGEANVR